MNKVKRPGRVIEFEGEKCFEIPLTRGLVSIVDIADRHLVDGLNWHAQKDLNTFYAVRMKGPRIGQQQIKIHSVILPPPPGMVVDHINRDGLDNRRKNLRLASLNQNFFNAPLRKNKASRFRGVGWFKKNSKWISQIKIDGKRFVIGYFDDEVEAARAWDQKALETRGEFALTNFQ